MITEYHAKYYANLLTQKALGGELDSLSQSLLNATVDINPHQIEAALFAFKLPLAKGLIMADEVGLGKTIEAGLVMCQYWSTGKHKIIVVCPASLRKQWSFELTEKFGIPNEILDTKNYNEYIRSGKNPFSQRKIVICSYYFAARKMEEIRLCGFDLAIIDEAHKLRNVYKKNAKTAHAIKEALADAKKLLLTATPFQNSLMELYGLTSIIDENIFGDSRSFRSEYVTEGNITDLRMRLAPYYKRTLRKDVTEYINYTKRLPLTQKFDATDLEQDLYDAVSEFLRRDDLYSVPRRQQMLTTMIIRKILASSTYALLGTLEAVKARLSKMLEDETVKQLSVTDWIDVEDMGILEDGEDEEAEETSDEQKINKAKLKAEIDTIQSFIDMAKKISCDSKAKSLLNALEKAFAQLPALGANRKALIFTESTRTQKYLKDFLEQNGYQGKIVLFNGSNSDKDSNAIYNAWAERNAYTGRLSGIKAADRRAALVDYFRDTAEVMIATEAAAEGLNLQFCSLVVNYDLPWNPQRIEQRIGRCHRYGQKSDVVVVNFINQRNFADMRVFSLLSEKFKLFDDVFGASDEVLGQTDGVDFERRIWEIYQQCRTEDEIEAAFAKLQDDMQEEIEDRLDEVKQQVLENFDIDVQEHLKLSKEKTSAFLNRYEYIFWELTKYILAGKAVFDDGTHTFSLTKPVPGCEMGPYRLTTDNEREGIPYRLSCPLAQYVLRQAQGIELPTGKITFIPSENMIRITLPEYLQKAHGYLQLSNLDITAFDSEQYSILTAYTSDGTPVPQEDCEKLFLCAGTFEGISPLADSVIKKLKQNTKQHITGKLQTIDSRNLVYFRAEEDRIFRWEQDMVSTLEKELDTVKRQIREMERVSRQAQSMEEKLEANRRLQELERQKRKKRNELADREDEIGEQRKRMIAALDRRMVKQTSSSDVFVIEWQVK